jgi:hypothetical protein
MDPGSFKQPWLEVKKAVESGSVERLAKFVQKKTLSSSFLFASTIRDIETVPKDKIAEDDRKKMLDLILQHLQEISPPIQKSLPPGEYGDPLEPTKHDEDELSIVQVFRDWLNPKKNKNYGLEPSDQVVRALWRERRSILMQDPLLAFHCVENGNHSMLKNVLKVLQELEAEDGKGKSVLHSVASQKYIKNTALSLAIHTTDEKSISLLGAFKSRPHIFESDKEIPLHYAIMLAEKDEERQKCAVSIVKLILKIRPQTLCIFDQHGHSPYQYAHTIRSEESQKIKSALKGAIFTRLRRVEDIAKALYGREGKSASTGNGKPSLIRTQNEVCAVCR